MNKNIKERCEEFVKVVNEKRELGLPMGLNDLKELAIELGTPIPRFDAALNLIWDDSSFQK